jgi:quinol monooxygenase YgiN
MNMKISRRDVLAGTALAALPCLVSEAIADDAKKTTVPKDAVILAVIVKAKSGQEQVVKEVLQALVEPTRKEQGCICYNLHQSKSDKAQFMFYEQWASQAALDAHGKAPHMKDLGEKLKDRTEKGDFTLYEVLE